MITYLLEYLKLKRLTTPNVGENVECWNPTAGGNVKWYNHFINFFKKLNVPLFKRTLTPVWPSPSTPGHLLKRSGSLDLYRNVQSNLIWNSLETTQMSTSQWMGKYTVANLHAGILFGRKKEWIIDSCNNMDESRHNYATWKQSDKKRVHTICTSLYKIPKHANDSVWWQ